MSIRAVVRSLTQNGRTFIRHLYFERNIKDVADEVALRILPRSAGKEAGVSSSSIGRSVQHHPNLNPSLLQNFQQHARRLFIDGVLKRVTNTLAADLRRKAAKRLLYGDSAPFLAFVGVSLASGTGIITKEDEMEGICWEIREAVSKTIVSFVCEDRGLVDYLTDEKRCVSLVDFKFGEVIAKGSSAVVYDAKLKQGFPADHLQCGEQGVAADDSSFPLAVKMLFNYDTESNALSILRSMHRETVPVMHYASNADVAVWEDSFAERCQPLPPHPNIVRVYCAFVDNVPAMPESLALYPDALPTRINPTGYGRNMSLFLVMKRYEATLQEFLLKGIPSVRVSILLLTQLLEAVAHMTAHGIAHRDLKADNILLDLSEGDEVCPSLVVSDFGCCLADRACGLSLPYSSPYTDRGGNAALMAPEVACAEPGPFTYINYSKADVWAVGTLTYQLFGMRNPFYFIPGEEANKGNATNTLRNRTYNDSDLPPLPDTVPSAIAQLIFEMLSRNPSRRVSAEFAATVCQLFLWAPSTWLHQGEISKLPSSAEILQWLLCLTTKVLCESRLVSIPYSSEELNGAEPSNSHSQGFNTSPRNPSGRRTLPEYQLIATFLRRIKLSEIRKVLKWMQTV